MLYVVYIKGERSGKNAVIVAASALSVTGTSGDFVRYPAQEIGHWLYAELSKVIDKRGAIVN